MIFCCNYWRVGKARRYRTNELIAVAINENNEQIVSARLLHEFLEVKTKFNDWISKRIEKYSFAENVDFVAITQKK